MNHPNRRLILALLAASTLIGSARAATVTGSGNAAVETRTVGAFQAISLRGNIDLVVRQGTRVAVQVRADDNILALVQTFVEGSGEAKTLRIQTEPGESLRTKTPIVVTVDVVRLEALASAGSGELTIQALKTPSLALSVAGSSNAKLGPLDTERLGISVAGSGNVQASGRATRLDISIAGSGDVRTRELAAGAVSVSIKGSGDASVTAQQTLSVAIAGSGDVEYGGGAMLAQSRIAGSGSVRQRQP